MWATLTPSVVSSKWEVYVRVLQLVFVVTCVSPTGDTQVLAVHM